MVEPSEQLQLVFDKAVDVAKKLQHEYVTIEHLLFAMLKKVLQRSLRALVLILNS